MIAAMKRLLPATVLLLLLGADAPTAKVKAIRYDELGAVVKSHRGKVVVVDFWADFCVPCKREYPRLVELHRKHLKDPVVVMAVALDDVSRVAAVERFVGKQTTALANYLLAEPHPLWQAKLRIVGPPLVIVFNKKGEIAGRFADESVDYSVIERLVARLATE